eukprot:1159218-Pelagomonas_calceolata.AAC.5
MAPSTSAPPPHHHHRSSQSHHKSSKHPPPAKDGRDHKGRPQAQPAQDKQKQQALEQRLRRETPFLATIRFKNDLPEVSLDVYMQSHCKIDVVCPTSVSAPLQCAQ